MIKVFIGYDPRQAVSYNVCQHSILIRTTRPVAIIPLVIETLPIKRVGLTPFTWTRFLVPYLSKYEGISIFLDADIIPTRNCDSIFNNISSITNYPLVTRHAYDFVNHFNQEIDKNHLLGKIYLMISHRYRKEVI